MKKSLKKQAVFPVLMLLVVTALALIGSSFAWFSMSSTAKVSTVEGTIEDSSIGLMISQDALNFKGTITLDKTAATFVNPYRFHQMSSKNGVNFFEAEIIRKATDGTATEIFSTASDNEPVAGTGADAGKLFGWVSNTSTNPATVENLPSAYHWAGELADTPVAENAAEAYKNQAGYMVFDLFFQVEKASKLYLDYTTAFNANKTGLNNSYSNKAMRVAFLSLGGVETGDKSAATLQSEAIALAPTTPVKTTIWNPNAASDATDYYGLMKAQGTSEAGFTPYVQSEATGEIVNAYNNGELFNETTAFTASDTMTGYEPIANLVAGVNKVRVVVWLEGNDASCTVKVANLVINMTLAFFAKANA